MRLMPLLPLASLAMTLAAPAALARPLSYPPTAAGDAGDTRFGVNVADPYRWLENDVRVDPKVKAWVEAQNKVTDAYLDTLPQRAAIKARLTELWNFERSGLPVRRGELYFFTRNSGLQNQSPLYVQQGLEGAPRLLIDPNLWASDGATALDAWVPSDDGRHLLYSVQDGGSDWRTLRVISVASGKALADEIKWVKFSNLAWAKDGSGFYYSRFPEPGTDAKYQATNTNQAIYFHRLGTPQSADRLVYATPDRPTLGHSAELTDDGRWLVITTAEGTDDRYEISIKDLGAADSAPRALFKGLEHSWSLIGNTGSTLYFVTNRDAPRYRVVSVDAAAAAPSLREIVAEGSGTIDGAAMIGDELLITSLQDARSVVRRYTLAGAPKSELALPGLGSVSRIEGKAGNAEGFYSFSSFNMPATIYRYDASSGASRVFRAPDVKFDPADYEVAQHFFTSKDGTRVPMFVVHKKGLDLSKGAPTLLYAYGGFNISSLPGFSPARLTWMEMGGVFALANIRGGGEYGKAWHDAGRLLNKQNVFDDFVAAGEYLIAKGISAKGKLAIEGRSNGGLLVGAVVNQRPDLFAAALPTVGVMDMLRFNQFTAGRYWTDDYGDPAVEVHFRNLLSYSPYHNIRGGKGRDYPAIMVLTADTDDRVVPGHSFKYVAALQAADIGNKPHLIRIETRAGHGSGKPTAKLIEEYADMWAFIGTHTGLFDARR